MSATSARRPERRREAYKPHIENKPCHRMIKPTKMRKFPTFTRMEKKSAIEMVCPTPDVGTVASPKARTTTTRSNNLRAFKKTSRLRLIMLAPHEGPNRFHKLRGQMASTRKSQASVSGRNRGRSGGLLFRAGCRC